MKKLTVFQKLMGSGTRVFQAGKGKTKVKSADLVKIHQRMLKKNFPSKSLIRHPERD